MSETPKVIHLWDPHQKQVELIESKARYKVIVCGRRSGKTTYAINTLVKEALKKENATFWYVAPTYSQGKMIAWRMLMEVIRKLPEGFVVKTNESELYITLFNGSYIHIKGADNPDSLRGVALHGVILDEYADFKPFVFEEVIEPTLLDHKGWAIFIGTPKGFNHFYELYTKAKTLREWASFKFTIYDNPHISRKEIEKKRQSTPEDVFAQEYLGDFRKRSDLVYKEFDRDEHIISELPKRGFVATIAGVDFGYTNPYAAILIGVDFDSNYWVFHEEYESHKTNNEIVETCKNLNKVHRVNNWYPDPAEPDRIEEMKRARLNCREANKDVLAGIDTIRGFFKSNRIRIHRSCKNLIRELESYHYPEEVKKDAKFDKNMAERPVKEDDHALDALRYALFTYEPTPVQTGEEFNLYAKDYA